jgi:hypothetical protein
VAPDPAAVEAVGRLLAEQGVATRAPAPSAGEWLADLGSVLRERLLGGASWAADPAAIETGLLVVVLLGAGVLLALLVAALAGRRRAVPERAGEPGLELAPSRAAAPPLDADAWHARLGARLAAGDAAGALEALWCWLLATLSGDGADPRPLAARRLVRAAGRRDLLPLLHGLEAASYGAEPLAPARVRELAREAERTLAR